MRNLACTASVTALLVAASTAVAQTPAKSPNLTRTDKALSVDEAYSPASDGLRQRYNGMLNVPLVEDKLGLRIVAFYRHEDGYVENTGPATRTPTPWKAAAAGRSCCGSPRAGSA